MKRFLPILAIVASAMWLAPARAAFENGVAAFGKGDYDAARVELTPLAEKGDPQAQYYIGVMYMDGLGVGRDDATAAKWLGYAALNGVADAQYRMALFFEDDEKGMPKNPARAAGWLEEAADQGHAMAQFRLGLVHRNGIGRPQSFAHAVKFFRLAAEQGLASAQYELGVHYWKGLGLPQDFERAASWSQRAADQGLTAAQINLGFMYATGRGLKKDLVRAHFWFNIASASGNKEAAAARATVAAQMTGAQIAEAQKAAGEWRPRKSPAAKPKTKATASNA